MDPLIAAAFAKCPWLVDALIVIGVLRAINKPLFQLIHLLVQKSQKDEQAVEKVEHSTPYLVLCFLLDWTASVKIPPKKAKS